MKVLMLIDSLVKGGRERRLIELLKDFTQREGIEVNLVLFSRRVEYPEIHDLNLKIYYLERKPKKDPRVFGRLYQITKKEQPDIIHSWGTMPSVYAIPTVKKLGIKFLNATIADAPKGLTIMDKRYLRARLTFPFSDLIVGNSQAGLAAYRAPKNRSRHVYNGFDFNRIATLEDPQLVRQRFGITTNKVVGMIGAFFDRKDFDTFIQGAILVLEHEPDTTFIAVGDGPNFERCKAQIPQELSDRILLPGMIDGVESLINLFTVGVLCTNTTVHGEGISNSILEYMVLGKPVVATTGGGTNEIVLHQQTGFLVANADAIDLSNHLKILLQQPQLAKRLGEAGRKKVYDQFTLPRMAQEYLQIYQELVPAKILVP